MRIYLGTVGVKAYQIYEIYSIATSLCNHRLVFDVYYDYKEIMKKVSFII